MDFVKVQGLRNDFLVFDEPDMPTSDDIVQWCDRRTGVGADGVLVIAPVTGGRIRMRYWNADGGEAEMCGNGLRCIARLAHERGWVEAREFVVETAVGDHPVSVGPDSVRAFVGVPKGYRTDTLRIAGQDVHPLSIGNPHAIVFVDDIDVVDVASIGPRIERDPMFPDRTNVEFVEVVPVGASEDDNEPHPSDRIRARIWERGVGETAASGTGATASAYMAHKVHGLTTPVVVALRGGELRVDFDEAGAWMDGPAEIVFTGSVG